MATDELNYQWRDYRRAIELFYLVARDPLGQEIELGGAEAETADARLEEVARLSDRMTRTGAELLADASGVYRERIATLLLAAAAVDVAVAYDALRIAPNRPQPDPEIAAPPPGLELESVEALIAEADEFFGLSGGIGGVAGAQDDPRDEEVLFECDRTFDTLIESAYDPAWGFGAGVISAGVGLVHLPQLNPIAELENLSGTAGFFKRHIVGLVRSGFQKLVAVSAAMPGNLAQDAAAFLEDEALKALGEAVRRPLSRLLAAAAGRDAARREVDAEIESAKPPPISSALAAVIVSDLHSLASIYTDQILWTNRFAKVLSFVAPLISTLAAPIGLPLVVALDGLGIGFVVYTLRTKITGRGLLGEVDGVVTLVERRVLERPGTQE